MKKTIPKDPGHSYLCADEIKTYQYAKPSKDTVQKFKDADNELIEILEYKEPNVETINAKKYPGANEPCPLRLSEPKTVKQLKQEPDPGEKLFLTDITVPAEFFFIVEWLNQQKLLILETLKEMAQIEQTNEYKNSFVKHVFDKSELTGKDDGISFFCDPNIEKVAMHVDGDMISIYVKDPVLLEMEITGRYILDCLYFIETKNDALAFYRLSGVITLMQKLFYDKLKLNAVKHFKTEKRKSKNKKKNEAQTEESRKAFFQEMQAFIKDKGNIRRAAEAYYDANKAAENRNYLKKHSDVKGWCRKAKSTRISAIRSKYYVVKKLFP